MNRIALLGIGIIAAASAFAGCSSDNGNGGNGGSGGSTGLAGAAGGSTGLAGAGPGGSTGQAGAPGIPFEAVLPCDFESDYMTGTTTVTFPTGGLAYGPKCLKVARGATVTIMSASSTFVAHPLAPSALRGTLTGNPIVDTSTGNSTTVTFPTPGFYAYYCKYHGSDSDGANMTGVVWVN